MWRLKEMKYWIVQRFLVWMLSRSMISTEMETKEGRAVGQSLEKLTVLTLVPSMRPGAVSLFTAVPCSV